MENAKYKLIDATTEEQQVFMKRFAELCTELSMYYEPVPQFTREGVGKPWEIVCQVYLAKKVPNDIPSPFVDKKDEDTTTV